MWRDKSSMSLAPALVLRESDRRQLIDLAGCGFRTGEARPGSTDLVSHRTRRAQPTALADTPGVDGMTGRDARPHRAAAGFAGIPTAHSDRATDRSRTPQRQAARSRLIVIFSRARCQSAAQATRRDLGNT